MVGDTFVDGCGVYPDAPIGKGTRIRFKLDEDRQQDISVYVEDGILHICGMYRPVIITFDQPNHFTVDTVRWHRKEDGDARPSSEVPR